MQYLLLFLEGIITFISPCLLPLLPLYVSYFAAGETDKKKALVNSLGFVLGFTLVFVMLGALSGAVGRLLLEYATFLNIVTGVIVIIFGLNFLGVLNIELLNRSSAKNRAAGNPGFVSSLLFGLVFSIGWTPCVGAFLGSALMLASLSASWLQGVLMLLVFSAGLGLPFVLSALLIERLKNTFEWIKQNYRIINTVSGALLIVIGILMATGQMGYFLTLLSY